MDAFVQFFIDWGYWGMFLSAFIAGSIVPLSSEAVLIACVGPLHLSPWLCLLAATAGNVSGGMTCYWLGTLGNMEWIEKYAHVNHENSSAQNVSYTAAGLGWPSSRLYLC